MLTLLYKLESIQSYIGKGYSITKRVRPVSKESKLELGQHPVRPNTRYTKDCGNYIENLDLNGNLGAKPKITIRDTFRRICEEFLLCIALNSRFCQGSWVMNHVICDKPCEFNICLHKRQASFVTSTKLALCINRYYNVLLYNVSINTISPQ